MKKYNIAIDIGASSGRHIVGITENGKTELNEVYRFPNGVVSNDDLYWDTESLFNEIVTGIKKCIEQYGDIESLSIDTWGVDYVLLKGDKEVYPVYAYRSARTSKAIEEVHKIIPKQKLYEISGEQFQPFNTVYQLYADKLAGRLDGVTDFLMIPEYFAYRLTGKKVKEYTNATTGALVNARTNAFDKDIITALGFNRDMFPTLHVAGETVGDLTPEIQKAVGGNVRVKLCASHDTACAFEAVDNEENTALISSGTWSLVGVKIKNADVSQASFNDNFANEGGVGYFRYLKNVMGMWLVNNCCKAKNVSVVDAVKLAEQSDYRKTFDANDTSLLAPDDMVKAIENLLQEKPSDKDLFSSVFHSLAKCYSKTISEIENNLKIKLTKIYIVGGGAKNALLNKLTERYSGKTVVAMPIEATALGNIKTQMRKA